jgi:hypothetical protein
LTDSLRTNHVQELRKRRRILIMIAFVTILFGVSWLPIHAFHVGLKFFPNSFPIWSESLFTIKNIAHTLTYLNSMLNPFFYTMMGNNFRKQVFTRRAKYSNQIKTYYIRGNHTTTSVNQNLNRLHKNSHSSGASTIGRLEIECNSHTENKQIVRFEFSNKKRDITI